MTILSCQSTVDVKDTRQKYRTRHCDPTMRIQNFPDLNVDNSHYKSEEFRQPNDAVSFSAQGRGCENGCGDGAQGGRRIRDRADI